MGTCDNLIMQNIEIDCNNPVVPGIEPNAIIINKQDVNYDATVFDAIRKNVIKTLALKAGKKGFKAYIPTNKPFNGTKTTMEIGANRNSFTNDFGIVILDNGPDVCEKIIDGLANGEFIVVFENKHKNINEEANKGDSTFQIMGFYQGLKATTLENDKYSEDTDGGWNALLQEKKAPKSGLFLYNTDITITRTQFESLVA